MDNIEKQFRVSSPKPRDPIREEDFNDFQYWHEPVLEVEELKRLETLHGKRETRDIDDPFVGVNGTIRRSGKAVVDDENITGIRKQPNMDKAQPTNINVLVVNQQHITIQSSPETRVPDRVPPKPPLPVLREPTPVSPTPKLEKTVPTKSQNVIVANKPYPVLFPTKNAF